MDISAVEIWLIVGIIFIIIEFSKIPGIGFLFLGLGALTTSALISSYPEISHDSFQNYVRKYVMGW